MSSPSDDDKDDKVGYGRPPKSTRFKKGQSGSPAGRPKQARGFVASLKREMERRITVREGNVTVVISKAEAIAKRLMEKALKGEIAALKMLHSIQAEVGAKRAQELAAAPEAEEIDPLDLDILRYFLASLDRDDTFPGDEDGKEDEDDDSDA